MERKDIENIVEGIGGRDKRDRDRKRGWKCLTCESKQDSEEGKWRMKRKKRGREGE